MPSYVFFTYPYLTPGTSKAPVPPTFTAWGTYKRWPGATGSDPVIACNISKVGDPATVLATGIVSPDPCNLRSDTSQPDPQWRALFSNLTLTGDSFQLNVSYTAGGAERSRDNVIINLDNSAISQPASCANSSDVTNPSGVIAAEFVAAKAKVHGSSKKVWRVPLSGLFNWDPRITLCKALVFQRDNNQFISLVDGQLSLGQYAVLVEVPAPPDDTVVHYNAQILFLDEAGKIYKSILRLVI